MSERTVTSLKRAFVSSTFVDLQSVRSEVRTALRKAGYLDVAMEYLAASDDRPLDVCLQLVADSDLYIGIFAWRYGFIPAGQHLSITNLEYRHARATGRPCIILLLADRAPWPVKFVDENRHAVEKFRSELSEEHVVGFFEGSADVAARLYEALHGFESSRGLHGVIEESEKKYARALTVVAERQKRHHASIRLFDFQKDIRIEDVYVQEILEPKRDKSPFEELEISGTKKGTPLSEMALLKNISTERGTSVYVIEGRAGAGKSTMLKTWMLNLLPSTTGQPPFPLFVALRHIDGDPRARQTLIDAICRTTPGLTSELVQSLFALDAPRAVDRDRPFLFLFDGLDEAQVDRRRPFLESLTILDRRQKAVISTRPGVISELGITPVRSRAYELCDLDENQIRQFLERWFARDLDLCRAILAKIESSSRLRDLATTPVLLTCLAMHAELGRGLHLPDDLAEGRLIEKSVEILVERWDAARDGRRPDPEFISLCFEVFTCLAAWPRYQDVPWKDFVAIVRDAKGSDAVAHRIVQNGRVVAGEIGGSVHFSHAIFYDFFYAEHFARTLD